MSLENLPYVLKPLRHRGYRSCQMDAPFQLKMIPALINLQKMSGQGVQTHHPMVLLAFSPIFNLSSLLSKKVYLLSLYEGSLYSVRSSVPLNGGKTFWLVMMALRWWQSYHCPAGGCQKLWEGWLAIIPVLSLCRRRGVGCDRLPEVTQDSPVESVSGSVDKDGPGFEAKAFGWVASAGSGQYVWTKEGVIRMTGLRVPYAPLRESGQRVDVPHVPWRYALWDCHVCVWG